MIEEGSAGLRLVNAELCTRCGETKGKEKQVPHPARGAGFGMAIFYFRVLRHG
jgi:hypothetical protein